MYKTEIIISINVHEKPNFLLKQIDNISNFVKSDFKIILNCNEYMHNELKNIILPNFVIINPEIINKFHDHGTLLKGMVSNLYYVVNNFIFDYFIILSSRNLFYNELNINNLYNLQKIYNTSDNESITFENYCQNQLLESPENYNIGHWPIWYHTYLVQYYIYKKYKLYSCAHEGLTFHYNVCKNIINFFDKFNEIKENLFSFPKCVEEFALHTISSNEINLENKYYGFIYIGHGCDTQHTIPTDKNLYVYKTIRE